jgi:hypothetical protein
MTFLLLVFEKSFLDSIESILNPFLVLNPIFNHCLWYLAHWEPPRVSL